MEKAIKEQIITESGVMELEQIFIEPSRRHHMGYDVVALYMNIMDDIEVKYYFQSYAQIVRAMERGAVVHT